MNLYKVKNQKTTCYQYYNYIENIFVIFQKGDIGYGNKVYDNKLLSLKERSHF